MRVTPPRVDSPTRVQPDGVVHSSRDTHPAAGTATATITTTTASTTASAAAHPRRRGHGRRYPSGSRGGGSPPQLPIPIVPPCAQPARRVNGGGVAPTGGNGRPRRARRG